MQEQLTWVEHFIDGLRASHSLKVLVACWCIGFFLKKWRWFSDNKLIPLLVIPAGAFLSVVLDHHHTDGLTVDQEKWDNAVVGLFLSTLAWVSHKFVWKNLAKIPVIGQYLDTGNSNPEAFVKGKNAEVEPVNLVDDKILEDAAQMDKLKK